MGTAKPLKAFKLHGIHLSTIYMGGLAIPGKLLVRIGIWFSTSVLFSSFFLVSMHRHWKASWSLAQFPGL